MRSLATGAFGDVTRCYSTNGVPLKTTMNSQGTTVVMEATAFRTTVTDADFKLPGPVRYPPSATSASFAASRTQG